MRSELYQAFLSRQGVDWRYLESVPVASINLQRSLRGQARLENPVDIELIDQYTVGYKAKDQFPAVVGYQTNRDQYNLIDGVQRTHAMIRAKVTETDLYLVETSDPAVIDRL